jgi:hypothetical protein
MKHNSVKMAIAQCSASLAANPRLDAVNIWLVAQRQIQIVTIRH